MESSAVSSSPGGPGPVPTPPRGEGKMFCAVSFCNRCELDGRMTRVPPGRRDYVIAQLGRDEHWSERAPKVLRVCAGHVATANPFALFPLEDDPLWALAHKSFQSAQVDASLSKSVGRLTYHPDVVALLETRYIDPVLSPPRPTPIDRSELLVPPPRLSATQSAQKMYVLVFMR